MSKISLDKDLEKSLIRKIQRGDKECFSLIYKHYHPYIKSYFTSHRIENQTGEDLASNVFERALKGIDNFKWQGLSLSSWLFKIARNVLIDYYRESEKSSRNLSPIDSANQIPSNLETPEESALRNDSALLITTLLKRTSEREARIIYLKFFEGYTNKSIAKMLNLSETNVGTIIYRVINKLREHLKVGW